MSLKEPRNGRSRIGHGANGPTIASQGGMTTHTNKNATTDDALLERRTDVQEFDPDYLPAPNPEVDSARSIVAEEVAAEAAERVLLDERVTAEEIAEQSAYPGLGVDVGQQAAHSERARAEAEPEPPTKDPTKE